MKRDKLKSQNIISASGIVLIIVSLALIFITNIFHYCYAMNSDIAAEAILGHVISETKQLVPSVWFSSTETRVINAANLAGLYNILCGKMNLSMGLACFTTTLLIVIAEIYLAYKWELNRISTIILVLLSLILPSTMSTLTLLYLFASYYGTCFIIYLFTLGFYADSIKKDKISFIAWIIPSILAFLLGLQGMRGLLVIYVPLFAIEFLRAIRMLALTKAKSPKNYIVLIWSAVLGVCSYFGTKMPFSTGASTTRNIRRGFEKLINIVIPSIGDTLRLGEDPIHDIFVYLLLLICLVELTSIIRKYFSCNKLQPREIGYLVTIASPIITALIISFTTTDNADRYYFMLLIAMAYSIPLFLENINSKSIKVIGVLLAFIISVYQMNYVYYPIVSSEEPIQNSDYEVAKSLVDRNIKMACSTFEHANTIMCLTDGKVIVRAIDSMEQMNPCQWLTNKEWFTRFNNTPVAVIATDNTVMDFENYLANNDIIVNEKYDIDIFHIFILEKDINL